MSSGILTGRLYSVSTSDCEVLKAFALNKVGVVEVAPVEDDRLLKQFLEIQRMMKQMKGGKLARMMAGFKGGMPPGFGPR